ncbi:MAG: hypothetical protein P8X86_20755 [Desulfofustis sp.]
MALQEVPGWAKRLGPGEILRRRNGGETRFQRAVADSDPVPPGDYRTAKREQKNAMKPFTIRSETLGKPYQT